MAGGWAEFRRNLPAAGRRRRTAADLEPKGAGGRPPSSLSPDGRRLAYAACGIYACDVYVQPLDRDYAPRGGPRRITQEGTYIMGLAWSRDAESLIYCGPLPLHQILWRAEIRGERRPERLELAGFRASHPSVALAGNRLAFSRGLSNYDIWRYQAGGAQEPLITSSVFDISPQFSPDGKRIAFSSGRSGEASEIWVVNADGSHPVQLTNRLGRYQGTPQWSPDGHWIAFDSQGQDGNWHIWVVEASGGRPRRLTSDPSDDAIPSWSRNGQSIYFRSERTGRREIWRAAFAGGQAEQITQNGGHTAFESVDGKTLFYTKDDSSPLFAQPLSGGPERQVLDWVESRGLVAVEDGIYYIGRLEDRQYPLRLFQFSTGTSRLIARVEGPLGFGLTVSPDRKSFLFTRSVASGADLMLIDNFR